MIKTENISYNRFLELEDKSEINTLLKLGIKKGVNFFELKDIEECSFSFVKDLQFYFNSDSLTWPIFIDLLNSEFNLSIEKLANTGIFNLYQQKVFFDEQILLINQKESTNLGHEVSVIEEASNIARFAKYKSFPQFDLLAHGDITKFDEVGKMKYNLCFTKLLYEAEKIQYQQEYNELSNIINKKPEL